MEKPLSFAGRVTHKGGKKTFNDYAQPEKFFADMAHSLRLIEEIPFSAIEDIQKYELNREIMINIVRRIFKVFRAADVDIHEEIKKQQTEDPFDGLEDDIEIQKQNKIKISGEE